MTPKEKLLAHYNLNGFVLGDQMKDLGLERDWLLYLSRKNRNNEYEYIWLTFDPAGGNLVQALLFVYKTPFNSRAKPPMTPVVAAVYRAQEELDSTLGIWTTNSSKV